MKISLSIWSCHAYLYDKTMTNAQFIDFVGASTLAEGVELLSIFWEPGKDVPEVKEALARNGLKLACFGACNNLAVPEPEGRRKQLEDITHSVDMAVLLGARIVRVFSGDKPEGVSFEEAKGWILEGLAEAARYAEDKGVTLCLENHGYFAGKAEQVEEVIRTVGSPALQSTFDTGNFLLVDQEPESALQKLLPLVRHVHIKDFEEVGPDATGSVLRSLAGKAYVGKAAGEGEVPLPRMLEGLEASGYKGWLTVEFEGAGDQKEGSVRSVRNLWSMLQAL